MTDKIQVIDAITATKDDKCMLYIVMPRKCLSTAQKLADKLMELIDKDIVVEVKRWREKRSDRANRYFWKLCGKLAKKLSSDKGERYSNVDIYREYIFDLGICKTFDISENAVDTLFYSWQSHGLGWLTKKVDYSDVPGFVTVSLYYGSSTFNTKHMSRLIDMVVQDCKAQGIETLTPDELERMKLDWRSQQELKRAT